MVLSVTLRVPATVSPAFSSVTTAGAAVPRRLLYNSRGAALDVASLKPVTNSLIITATSETNGFSCSAVAHVVVEGNTVSQNLRGGIVNDEGNSDVTDVETDQVIVADILAGVTKVEPSADVQETLEGERLSERHTGHRQGHRRRGGSRSRRHHRRHINYSDESSIDELTNSHSQKSSPTDDLLNGRSFIEINFPSSSDRYASPNFHSDSNNHDVQTNNRQDSMVSKHSSHVPSNPSNYDSASNFETSNDVDTNNIRDPMVSKQYYHLTSNAAVSDHMVDVESSNVRPSVEDGSLFTRRRSERDTAYNSDLPPSGTHQFEGAAQRFGVNITHISSDFLSNSY